MKTLKLSGREAAVLRAIDYATGSTGAEIQERTQIAVDDLVDILNGLCDMGYVEVTPHSEKIEFFNCADRHFDINPSYALDIREMLRR